MTAHRRRLLSSSPPGLDDDDILSEILLRLPPLPSSLPRASLVCKRWRRLVSEPHFLRRFREHHRKPPILGFFSQFKEDGFIPALDSPDSIPASRFSLQLDCDRLYKILDCRHGSVLLINWKLLYFLVWAPVTGEQRRVDDIPPSFRAEDSWVTNGAVVCVASEQGHMHGGCHSSPFQVVLLGYNSTEILACVYSSETCAWGNVVSLVLPQNIDGVSSFCPSALVENSLFWFLSGIGFRIVRFDLCSQSLAAIELPSAVDFDTWSGNECQFLIVPADGGGLSFLYLSGFTAQVWKWKDNCDGGTGWMLGRNVDLNNLLSLKAGVDTRDPEILGMAEDDNTLFLSTDVGDFAIHLESMQFKRHSIIMSRRIHYPFRSFYYAGT